jgi:hypothetical protein
MTADQPPTRKGTSSRPRIGRWSATVARLRRSLDVTDEEWDRVYPWQVADLSSVFWTPVAVARRAAQLLSEASAAPVLDVGAGVGKFCVIGALTTSGTFVGAEKYGDLLEVARSTARRASAVRVQFIHSRVEDVDWTQFGGFYFFNPFMELGGGDPGRAHARRCERLVLMAEERLTLMGAGTRVVTYHGFGGNMPASYELVLREPSGTDVLECWERAP